MAKLPQVESDFSELNNLYFGTVASRLMMTAIAMKVFDHLEQPRSSSEIAQILASDPGNTELMLDALCACDLISKKNGVYQNSQKTSDFLVSGKPAYLGEWFQQADEASQPFLASLEDKVRFGPGDAPEEENMNSEAYCEHYTASHAASSLGGIAFRIAEQIAGLPAFSDCRTMLDLGGGPAINAMAVAQENLQLRVTVFDRPSIARLAQNYIQSYGFQDRVTAVGGDYLKDSLGQGYDLIMITDSLYYEDQEIDPVLQKCRDALNPGGRLAAIHAVLTHERTRPMHLVLDLLNETMSGQARLPEKGFLVRALERCGFKDITSKMVNIGGTQVEMNLGHT
ncbi:MAG: methyltransferase [Desulfarculaceae bacterium]|jgi:predicted O-methyltransferase YrrM